MRGTVFVNTRSGANAAEDDPAALIASGLPGADVEACAPEELGAAISREVASGAQWVGVAGGDGTIRLAAERLVGTSCALLPVPMGTLNHFARQLGIESLEAAAAAMTGVTQRVDVGDVNGHVFVNNASVGLYPLLVEGRERRMGRLPKRFADLAALTEELGKGHRLTVCLDDSPVQTWMVFVGNNRYCNGLFSITERARLTEGILDIRLVRAEGRLSRARVLMAAIATRLAQSPLVESREVAEIVMDPTPQEVSVALDGEVVELCAPLRFRSRPGALMVRIPPSQDFPAPTSDLAQQPGQREPAAPSSAR